MFAMKIYICHSISLTLKLLPSVEKLEKRGYSVYFPGRDTNQQTSGKAILAQNFIGIKDADEIWVYWDGASQGTLFDIGMAYALGKKIIFKEVKLTWAAYARELCQDKNGFLQNTIS